jgi:hypothetical protein
MDYFSYLVSMIANDAIYTREIKSRISTGKATFNKKKIIFTTKEDLNLREKTTEILYLEHNFIRC